MNSIQFTFKGYTYDLEKGQASFDYSVEGEESHQFVEKIYFPSVEAEIPEQFLKKIFDNLSLILGISYWKLYCPKQIIIQKNSLNREQADFWNKVYTKGLGEFFYKNKIDYRGLIKFPYEVNAASVISIPRKTRSLVLLGGGKDSIVTSEKFKEMEKPFDILMIGEHAIPLKIAKIIGKIPIVIKTELDTKLFELNQRQDTYNGHVPVSAIYAFLGIMAAAFYDYSEVVVSNEKSANFGNVNYLGEEINHQWSKSEEFERLFQDYSQKFITPDVEYSSYLRELDEFEITEIFSKYNKYFTVFSSCNRNFKINSDDRNKGKRWCGECPKCLFVFILLSAFIPKQELIGIFGKNLFEDEKLLPLLKETIGVSGFKPFECVGTPQEAKKALEIASKRDEYKEDSLMKFYERL
ncbi:MAG: hypothetical protein A2798_00205 [Candidatus Levybacteria bacterium RIFCSPHIGHO2_01_FULL_37_17]|nr:MAG: hypothetical protein A2798_00205 [Candidatus Levybacteria bacterium RIFCSPHIGHO2_01_FULL_37_17]OGH36482.1 MAG: hypothetical protein A2959_03160 [Candidatus Levybacteria bacterium RIFCSPLOWO2_01_FULL_38_23]